MRTYVISLKRTPDRRQSIERQLRQLGLPYEVIDAVDGKGLTFADRAQYSAQAAVAAIGRELVPEEIGCALSHLAVYRRMLEAQAEALILEDDAVVGPDLLAVLGSRQLFPSDWEIMLFSHSESRAVPWGKKWVTTKHQAVRFWSRVCLTSGYLLSLGGAEKLLRHAYPIRFPADVLTGWFRKTGISLYGIVPRCVGLAAFPSTIWAPDDPRHPSRRKTRGDGDADAARRDS